MTTSDVSTVENKDLISERPLTSAELERMPLIPAVGTLRRRLRCTQEEFSLRYSIPLGTLRDWEQGRSQPDAAVRAYLKVIAADPERIAQLIEKQVA